MAGSLTENRSIGTEGALSAEGKAIQTGTFRFRTASNSTSSFTPISLIPFISKYNIKDV